MNLHDKADEILRTVISKNNEVLEQQQKFHKKETARLDKLTFITLENQRMLEAAFRTQNINKFSHSNMKLNTQPLGKKSVLINVTGDLAINYVQKKYKFTETIVLKIQLVIHTL